MKYTFTPCGTCSRLMEFEINDGKISNLRVTGGCNGNLKGIGALCEDRDARSVADLLRGIRCGNKPTSCPDQLAAGITAALDGNL